jgi:type III secretion protein U
MSSKQFPASPKRLLRARKEGKVSKSLMLQSQVGLSIGFYLIYLLQNSVLDFLKAQVSYCLNSTGLNPSGVFLPLVFLALTSAGFFITIIATVFVTVEFVQLGGRVYVGAIYNSTESRFAGGMTKLWSAVVNSWQQALFLILGIVVLIPVLMHRVTFRTLLFLVSVGLVMSIGDWWIQKRKHLQGMRMDRKELMDELKDSEGDPHVKAKRQSLQRAFVHESLEMRVKQAKVIIVDRDVSRRSSKIYRRTASAF